MKKRYARMSSKQGLPPGTAVYVGEAPAVKTSTHIVQYSNEQFFEPEKVALKEVNLKPGKSLRTWIRVVGLEDVEGIKNLCASFSIHSLIVEDVLNTKQRLKTDCIEGCVYTILRISDSANEDSSSQVSLILTDNVLLTFQEKEGACFDPVRERLNLNGSRVRQSGMDYLFYVLLDALVDSFFSLLEGQDDAIEALEDLLIERPNKAFLKSLYTLKRKAVGLRKNIRPLKDIVGVFLKDTPPLISKKTLTYFRDLYDHSLHLIERVDTHREMVGTMMEVYLSSMSNKMNDTMKILTIFSAIFIPLTFIAGVYGMNFNYMPELKWHYGYFFVLAIMLIIVVLLLSFFKKKDWF